MSIQKWCFCDFCNKNWCFCDFSHYFNTSVNPTESIVVLTDVEVNLVVK